MAVGQAMCSLRGSLPAPGLRLLSSRTPSLVEAEEPQAPDANRLLWLLWRLVFLRQRVPLQLVALGILHLECASDYSDCQPEHHPAR